MQHGIMTVSIQLQNHDRARLFLRNLSLDEVKKQRCSADTQGYPA
jgi:hypothetical protein